MNREAWLNEACKRMKPWVDGCAESGEFEMPLISVGWPRGSRGGKGHIIGQCWDKKVSGDKTRAHIFIAPDQTDPVSVLSTLLHEVVHASVGTACGHRKEFRKVALELGFTMPMTSTPMGEELKKTLTELAKDMGEFPHPGLTRQKKKVGSRLIKVMCPSCGCIVRMTRVWLDNVGAPMCGCSDDPHVRMQED